MKNKTLILLASIIICGNLSAQAPVTLWTKSIGGSNNDWIGKSIIQTADGGFIMTGLYGGGNSADVWLVKTTALGDTLWTKTFGGSNDDVGSDLVKTSDGGYLIAGTTESFGAGKADIWLIKTDASGNELWNKTFGGSAAEDGASVEQTSDGGYIITGSTDTVANGWTDVWLIKTDASGEIIWEKSYGGTDDDHGHSVQQTTDGGYIIAGENDNLGAWLVKTDASGNMVWNKAFGGNNPSEDEGYSVQQTSDGGYILAAETESFGPSDSTTYAWLIKTDDSGDTLWTRRFFKGIGAGVSATMGYGNSVLQTSDGGYIFTGFRGPDLENLDLFLTKTDELGNEQWTAIINNAAGMCLNQTDNGEYIVGGLTISPEGDDLDIFLARFEAVPTGLDESVGKNLFTYQLSQNYPNPFNPTTRISYVLSKAGFVTLKIFDVLGKEIQTLVSQFQNSNTYSVYFDAGKLSSGIYFYRINAGDFVETKKMLLIR
jgi:hypothetical protein